jgi:hypothetical protein
MLKIPCDCPEPRGDPFTGNIALHVAHASERFFETEPHLQITMEVHAKHPIKMRVWHTRKENTTTV